VNRIDVHFARIHGAEVPGGEPGHWGKLYAGVGGARLRRSR
jgi:hypothetical protein